MHGFTLQPVFGRSGMLTEIIWRIESDGDWLVLRYTENKNQPVEIDRWQADAAVFKYKGEQSHWMHAWPPDKEDGVLARLDSLQRQMNEMTDHQKERILQKHAQLQPPSPKIEDRIRD